MAAANAHIFSTAVEHSKAVVVDTAHIGQHDDKEQLSEDQQALPEVATYQEQELPEGVTVTKWEEWAYYLYYNGNNGVGPIGYAATLFQSLLNSAGHDSVTGGACDGTGVCMLNFGGEKPIASVVLIANGISFAVMTLLFTTIGSCADYGSWNRWILFVSTLVCWASQFGMMGCTGPEQWHAAMALYMLGFITYGLTLVFYASVFPRLARNTQRTKNSRYLLDNGEIHVAEYEQTEMLERNRLSNISTVHSNWGALFVLTLNLALLLPKSIATNPKVDQYTVVLTNAYWVLLGIPWFILQKSRRGPSFPPGTHWWSIGWIQIFKAVREFRRLPHTFIFLAAFFLLADGLNTNGTLVGIVQNQRIQFSFLQSTYLTLVSAITSIFSCYAFWYIQRYKKISTKKMFVVTNVVTVFIPLWGMIGIWTKKFGFHNIWEFWAYNAVYGLGQAPYWAYSQTMMSELTPPGFEGMFFGLFGLTNRASSIIGPNVVQAIITSTGNEWKGFAFLFAICAAAALVIFFFVDIEKGRAHAVAYSLEKRGQTAEIRAVQTVLPEDQADLKG